MNDAYERQLAAVRRRRRERRTRIAAVVVALAMLLPVLVFAFDAVSG